MGAAMQKELSFEATPVFYANLEAYQQGYPIIVNEGSSRSSKSYSLMQLMICLAFAKPKIRISVVSHSLPHVKRGVYRDFKVIMDSLGIWDDNKWRATDFVYYFENGSYIELFGLDDESRARGPGRDVLWINEANLVPKYTFQQLAMRTTGTIFADLNPSEFTCYWYDLADEPKNKRIHSTYKQNLANLSQMQIDMLEGYKNLPDDFMYKVYTLGLRGASKETIYTHWQTVTELPGKGDVFYGLDFGFTNPCACVKIEHYEGVMYVQEILYQSGLTNPAIAALLRDKGVGREPVYCDAAEPKSIEEIAQFGFNVHPADKDVWAGIVKVKSQHIHVTANSKNLISELGSYKWKLDKDGNVIEEPVKANDHLMDAMRYGIFTHLLPKIQTFAF